MWDYLNSYRGIRGFTREVFYDCATVGYGIGMKDFQTQLRKVIHIEPNELRREMKDLTPQIEEAAQGREVLETEEEIEEGSVTIKPYKEVEKIVKVFEGTRLRSMPFEDVYFPNFIPETSNLDFPPMVMVQTEMPLSDVELKAKTGVWDKKKVKRVRAGDQGSFSQQAESIKQIRERMSGVEERVERKYQDRRII